VPIQSGSFRLSVLRGEYKYTIMKDNEVGAGLIESIIG
jgi:hypothetical protein